MKEEVSIRLISHESELPDIASHNFFHSVDFFRILEATPMQEPCMAIAEDGTGHVVAHMLTTIFFHRSLLPPIVYLHGRVYSEGEYDEGVDKSYIFGRFLSEVTARFNNRLCLYIEFSHLSNKMFGYEAFRANGYFPIQWQEIHNSLHSLSPADRLSEKAQHRIAQAQQSGLTACVALAESNELVQAAQLLRRHFRFKPRRTVPNIKELRLLVGSGQGKVFVSKHGERVVATCVCIYSGGNAYMWYLAYSKKRRKALSPMSHTVWTVLDDAHKAGYRHLYFLDAGLPFEHSAMREFILSFGGKPVTKFRWFRTPISWLNRIFSWLYSE